MCGCGHCGAGTVDTAASSPFASGRYSVLSLLGNGSGRGHGVGAHANVIVVHARSMGRWPRVNTHTPVDHHPGGRHWYAGPVRKGDHGANAAR
jgi:hypothetical protein